MGVYLGILREENINKKALWGYIGGLYEVFMGINKDFGWISVDLEWTIRNFRIVGDIGHGDISPKDSRSSISWMIYGCFGCMSLCMVHNGQNMVGN